MSIGDVIMSILCILKSAGQKRMHDYERRKVCSAALAMGACLIWISVLEIAVRGLGSGFENSGIRPSRAGWATT